MVHPSGRAYKRPQSSGSGGLKHRRVKVQARPRILTPQSTRRTRDSGSLLRSARYKVVAISWLRPPWLTRWINEVGVANLTGCDRAPPDSRPGRRLAISFALVKRVGVDRDSLGRSIVSTAQRITRHAVAKAAARLLVTERFLRGVASHDGGARRLLHNMHLPLVSFPVRIVKEA